MDKDIALQNIPLSTRIMTAAQISSHVEEKVEEAKSYVNYKIEEARNTDNTKFQVYATSSVIEQGTIDEDTGLPYVVEVSQGMKVALEMYSAFSKEQSDISIDWGDGNISSISELSIVNRSTIPAYEKGGETYYNLDDIDGLIWYDEKENEKSIADIQILHTYKNVGKYYVTVYGNRYHMIRNGLHYGINQENPYKYCIVSEIFGFKCRFASCVRNVSSFASKAQKLQRIYIPVTTTENITNASNMFAFSSNLLEFTASPQNTLFSHRMNAIGGIFYGCTNLSVIQNFYLPTDITYVGDGSSAKLRVSYSRGYEACYNLSQDIISLLPIGGFKNKYVNVKSLFNGNKNLSCSDYELLAETFWKDKSKKFYDFSEAFKNCQKLKDNIPSAWGGSNADIIVDDYGIEVDKGPLSGTWDFDVLYTKEMLSSMIMKLGGTPLNVL